MQAIFGIVVVVLLLLLFVWWGRAESLYSGSGGPKTKDCSAPYETKDKHGHCKCKYGNVDSTKCATTQFPIFL